MKKWFAFGLALCLMLSAAALAETAAPTEIKWSDLEASAKDVPGQLTKISDTGLQMFIPASFKEGEITETAKKNGVFLSLKNDEGSAIATASVLNQDIEAFKAALPASGAVGLKDVVINGLHFTNFNVTADGVLTTSFIINTDQNSILMFSFSPADKEPFTNLFKLMAGSIQKQAQ